MSQVCVRSGNNVIGVWHHGILLDDNTVIHYQGTWKNDALITRTSFAQFANQRTVYQYVYENQSVVKAADQVQQRAMSKLGQRGYNLFTNNCETFARWCMTGVADSVQVTNAMYKMMQLIPVAGPCIVMVCKTFISGQHRGFRMVMYEPQKRAPGSIAGRIVALVRLAM